MWKRFETLKFHVNKSVESIVSKCHRCKIVYSAYKCIFLCNNSYIDLCKTMGKAHEKTNLNL